MYLTFETMIADSLSHRIYHRNTTINLSSEWLKTIANAVLEGYEGLASY
jgi:hypothetical protein